MIYQVSHCSDVQRMLLLTLISLKSERNCLFHKTDKINYQLNIKLSLNKKKFHIKIHIKSIAASQKVHKKFY